jgi:hypothetical protein
VRDDESLRAVEQEQGSLRLLYIADSKSVTDLREPPGRERSRSRARAELAKERSERLESCILN